MAERGGFEPPQPCEHGRPSISNRAPYRSVTSPWWVRWDSTHTVPVFETGASADWATDPMVPTAGFEPATPRLSTWCLCQVGLRRRWCHASDSNREPPASETGASTHWASMASYKEREQWRRVEESNPCQGFPRHTGFRDQLPAQRSGTLREQPRNVKSPRSSSLGGSVASVLCLRAYTTAPLVLASESELNEEARRYRIAILEDHNWGALVNRYRENLPGSGKLERAHPRSQPRPSRRRGSIRTGSSRTAQHRPLPGALDGMVAHGAQALNGWYGDGPTGHGSGRPHTRAHRLAVDQHGASAALRHAATELGAGQGEHVAQHPEGRHAVNDGPAPLSRPTTVGRRGRKAQPYSQSPPEPP